MEVGLVEALIGKFALCIAFVFICSDIFTEIRSLSEGYELITVVAACM